MGLNNPSLSSRAVQIKLTQVEHPDKYLTYGKYLINTIDYSRLDKIPWLKEIIALNVSGKNQLYDYFTL